MVSNIDATKPLDDVPAVKSDLRANLAAAKLEIEALQAVDVTTTDDVVALQSTTADLAAAVAAGDPVVTSYGNAGGSGDRTSLITVLHTGGLINSGTPDNLVDGGVVSGTADSVSFAANAVAGVVIQFDFGALSSKVINEATWAQSGTETHGDWQWQGSQDALSWNDLGVAFTLGGATSQVQTELSTNVIGYRYYRLLGVSGTASASPFIQEITFKIANGLFHERGLVPPGGAVGQSLTKTGTGLADYDWNDVGESYRMHRDGLISEWLFQEGSGTTVADAVSDNNITLSTSPTSAWTSKGVRLVDGLAETAEIAGARTVAILYRVQMDEEAGFLVSGGASSGSGILGSTVPTSSVTHMGTNGGVFPFAGDSGAGQGAFHVNRGGWALLFYDLGTNFTSKFGLGGRHSTTTSRCAEFELGWAGVWDDTLTDGERQTVYEGVRAIGARRGIYITAEDCPNRVNMALLWGQSNADGRAAVSLLSAADQLRLSQPSVLIGEGNSNNNSRVNPTSLVIGRNQKRGGATQFGPEVGAAFSHDDALATQNRDLFISKFTPGSSMLQDSSIVTPPNGTWNVNESLVSGGRHYWYAIKALWTQQQTLMMRGIGPHLRALWWMQGEQDAVDQNASADYQDNLQDLWDGVKSLNNAQEATIIVARIREEDPSMDPTAATEVRAAQAAFVTANSDAVLIDTDTFPLLADNVHYNEVGQVSLGNGFYSNTSLLK